MNHLWRVKAVSFKHAIELSYITSSSIDATVSLMTNPWCSITDIHRGFHSSWDMLAAPCKLIHLLVLLKAERKSMYSWRSRLITHRAWTLACHVCLFMYTRDMT